MARRAEPKQREPKQAGRAKMMADLEADNRGLRRRIASLEKKLARYEDADWEGPEDDPLMRLTVVQQETPLCPTCGSADIFEMKTPTGKLLRGCRGCKSKL